MICNNLQDIRIQRGITQKEIAFALKVSRQAVSRWENGISYPSSEQIQGLASIFELTADEIKQALDKDRESKNESDSNDWNCKDISRQINDVHLTLKSELEAALTDQARIQEEFNSRLMEERALYDRRLKKIIIAAAILIILTAFVAFGVLFALNYKNRHYEYDDITDAIEVLEEET